MQTMPHPRFPQITCSRDGKIYSVKTGKLRSLWKTRHGYLQLAVGRTSYLAHRLIADVFIPNHDNKPCINHKNGIKDDNRVENLEWVTHMENIRHARDILGVKYSLSGLDSPTRKVSLREIKIMINLWKFGFSYKQISKIVGYCVPTVVRHLEERKLNDKNTK